MLRLSIIFTALAVSTRRQPPPNAGARPKAPEPQAPHSVDVRLEENADIVAAAILVSLRVREGSPPTFSPPSLAPQATFLSSSIRRLTVSQVLRTSSVKIAHSSMRLKIRLASSR